MGSVSLLETVLEKELFEGMRAPKSDILFQRKSIYSKRKTRSKIWKMNADELLEQFIIDSTNNQITKASPTICLLSEADILWDENKNSDIIAALIRNKELGIRFARRIEKIFNINGILNDNETLDVTREDSVGNPKEENSGRTDITLLSQNYRIIIENKILSGDGYGQLNKYIHAWEKKTEGIEKRTMLYIYLTLWGTKPSENSLWGNDSRKLDSTIQRVLNENRLICISYRKDIIEWLEEYESEDIDPYSFLRSAVNQYKGALIQMSNEDIIFGIIRKNSKSIASLNKEEWATILKITEATNNILIKIDILGELERELKKKFESSGNHILANQLRFTINQSALFDNIEKFREESLKTLYSSTYLGLVCCAGSHNKCYGIGYEFTKDTSEIKRKIGFMTGEGNHWKKTYNKVAKEKETQKLKGLANQLYNLIIGETEYSSLKIRT